MIRPSIEECWELAKSATLVPVAKSVTADLLTPVSAFLKIAEHSDYAFLFESVEGGEQVARYSFLGKDPFLVLHSAHGKTTIDRSGHIMPGSESDRTGSREMRRGKPGAELSYSPTSLRHSSQKRSGACRRGVTVRLSKVRGGRSVVSGAWFEGAGQGRDGAPAGSPRRGHALMSWPPALLQHASQRTRDAQQRSCYTPFPWLPLHESCHRAWNVRRGDRTRDAIHGSARKDSPISSCS